MRADSTRSDSNPLAGTILADVPYIDHGPNGRYANLLGGAGRGQVNWSGELVYAVTGERGSRLWWFAGIGQVAETEVTA